MWFNTLDDLRKHIKQLEQNNSIQIDFKGFSVQLGKTDIDRYAREFQNLVESDYRLFRQYGIPVSYERFKNYFLMLAETGKIAIGWLAIEAKSENLWFEYFKSASITTKFLNLSLTHIFTTADVAFLNSVKVSQFISSLDKFIAEYRDSLSAQWFAQQILTFIPYARVETSEPLSKQIVELLTRLKKLESIQQIHNLEKKVERATKKIKSDTLINQVRLEIKREYIELYKRIESELLRLLAIDNRQNLETLKLQHERARKNLKTVLHHIPAKDILIFTDLISRCQYLGIPVKLIGVMDSIARKQFIKFVYPHKQLVDTVIQVLQKFYNPNYNGNYVELLRSNPTIRSAISDVARLFKHHFLVMQHLK